MKNKILYTFCLLLTAQVLAQHYMAPMGEIRGNGLHKILLTPEIRSASQGNTNFLRLLDGENNEIPYVILQRSDQRFVSYQPLNILSTTILPDSLTAIILENNTGDPLEKLTLKIANTQVDKTYTVSGSDDLNTWYGLISDQRLTDLYVSHNTYTEKTIFLPLHAYPYIRITIDDTRSLPINVLESGVYQSRISFQAPIMITDFTYRITEDRHNKKTKIVFNAPVPQQVDTIIFDINTVRYVREAQILVQDQNKVKKGAEGIPYVLSNFQLNSENKRITGFQPLFNKEFFLEIANKDNPPLEFASIQLAQTPLYLVADLQEQKEYKIIVDSTLSRPHYDLGNFVSELRTDLPEAVLSSMITLKKDQETTEIGFWQTPAFMWTCLIVGILIIGYFSLGLLKDLKA